MEREYPNPYGAVTAVDFGKYFDYNKANQENAEQQLPAPQAPAPLYQAPVESGFDYNAANAQIAAQNPQAAVQSAPAEQRRYPSWDEINSVMTGPMPEPTKPQATQDRLSRIMKVKALGEGLGALGDIFALSQGANVNRRGPDQSISRYRQLFEQNEADYLRRMDDYNRELHRQKLQSLMFGVQRGDRQEDINYRRDRDAKGDQFRTDTFEWQKERHAEAERKAEERYIAQTKAAEERYKQQFGLDWQRNKIAQEKWHIEKKMLEDQALFEASGGRIKPNANGYNLYTSDGKGQAVVVESKGELQKLYTLIVNHHKNSTDFTERMKMLEPSMGSPGNKNEQELIVGEYWEKTPAVIEFLRNTGKLEAQQAPQPHTNSYLQGLGVTQRGSAPAPAPTQTTTKQPQYNTAGYY